MCTASHNPKAYTGAKLVREGALALSGDEGIQDIRALIEAERCRRAAAAAARVEQVDIYDDVPRRRARASSTRRDRQAAEGRRRRRQRHGRADGRPAARAPRARPRRRPTGRRTATSPTTSRTRCCRRTAEFIIDAGASRAAPTSASPGTATPTAASSSTTPARSSTATSSPRCSPSRCCAKNPGATILYDVRASRAVARHGRAPPAARAFVNRVGHAFFKTRMREEGALFGGEVSGHYYFRDFYCADSGTIPALLMLELLSQRGRDAVASCSRPTARATSSPARSTPRSPTSRRRWQQIAERYARRAPGRTSTASRSTTTTGTSTCARRTPSRCCACASSRSSRTRTWSAGATRCSR